MDTLNYFTVFFLTFSSRKNGIELNVFKIIGA